MDMMSCILQRIFSWKCITEVIIIISVLQLFGCFTESTDKVDYSYTININADSAIEVDSVRVIVMANETIVLSETYKESDIQENILVINFSASSSDSIKVEYEVYSKDRLIGQETHGFDDDGGNKTADNPVELDSAIIYEITDLIDTVQPLAAVVSPTSGSKVTESPVLIQVAASDTQSGIEWVKIGDSTGVPAGEGIYELYVHLDSGINSIQIVVQDVSGNQRPLNISLNYNPDAVDTTGPVLERVAPAKDTVSDDSVLILVSAVDSLNEVEWVTINGIDAVLEDGTYGRYIKLDKIDNPIEIIAQDNHANMNKDTLALILTYIPQTPTNNAPLLTAPIDTTITSGQQLTITLEAVDPDSNSLTYSAPSLPAGASFTDLQFQWTPDSTQAGTHTVLFQVTDDGEPEMIDTARITITVQKLNKAPVLTVLEDTTIKMDQKLTITLSALDPDSDALTYDVMEKPDSASFLDTLFSWTPRQADTGTHTVKFKVTDDGTPQGIDSITITVTVLQIITDFEFTSNTGNNMVVGIPAAANPTVVGAPLAIGDTIAVFTPGGLLVGKIPWNDSPAVIIVWGDDTQTVEVEGIEEGEELIFKIFDVSEGTVVRVNPSYESGTQTYISNGIAVLDGLSE
jgi:hypothetical protein